MQKELDQITKSPPVELEGESFTLIEEKKLR